MLCADIHRSISREISHCFVVTFNFASDDLSIPFNSLTALFHVNYDLYLVVQQLILGILKTTPVSHFLCLLDYSLSM